MIAAVSQLLTAPADAAHNLHDRSVESSGGLRRGVLVAVRWSLVLVLCLLATAAGLGWLWLLLHARAVATGPRLHEALALQRLAGDGAQPLARIALAWLPTGLALGLALAALRTGRTRRARAGLAFGTSLVLLMAAGAASDAVTANERLSVHLSSQPGRLSTWVAAGLLALGAALPGRAARSR